MFSNFVDAETFQDEWLVLPYELSGLDETEIELNKAWIKPILDELTILS